MPQSQQIAATRLGRWARDLLSVVICCTVRLGWFRKAGDDGCPPRT